METDFVKSELDKPWDWELLSKHPNITWNIVRDNPDKPWDWKTISGNPNIVNWKIVKSNPKKPWDWSGLSENPNISWKILNDNPDKPWDWDAFSGNVMNYQKRWAVMVLENKWLEKMYMPSSRFVNTVLKNRFENMKAVK